MKLKLLYIAFLVLLSACSDDHLTSPTYTVGEADNAIVLRAGISEGGAGVMTRALANPDANHANHVSFKENTKVKLRVDGEWWKTADATSGDDVKKETVAQIGDIVSNTNDRHRELKDYTPQLYWDDYGTADPSNVKTTTQTQERGRNKGLNIYGIAVDGKTSLPSTPLDLNANNLAWDNISWNVGSVSNNVINQKSGWGDYDLLTSNNVLYNASEAEDNAYKFDNRDAGKLLEFTHAMSKITVNLTAGEGFVDNKFVNKPEVTLLNFYYTGNVNVEAKTSSPTDNATTNISAHLAKVKATSGATEWSEAPTTWASSHQTQYDALTFPGNSFSDNIDIIKIEADGNIYYVNATKINVANTETNNKFEQGKNYVFKITVNKTGIDNIEATVKDWEDVTAGNEAPVINIVTNYGDPTTGGTNPSVSTFTKDYTFLRSLNNPAGSPASDINQGYKDNRWMKNGTTSYKMYDEATGNTESPLYWSDHSSHYFFRGVYPRLGTSGDGVPVKSQIIENTVTYDVIAVNNEKYTHDEASGHCPSDLLIAYPHPYEDAENQYATQCRHNQDIETNGICATEGKIVMNFEHAMSQVEVKLVTNITQGATNSVTFDKNTKVEIIGGYKDGYILLKDGSSNFYGKTVADYKMHREHESTNAAYHNDYLDAIIPQSLVAADGTTPTLKFKITVKSENHASDTDVDTYETVMGIKDIPIQGGSKTNIWEPGKKYIYTLTITKTGIVSVATIKDWEEVEASEKVWF